MATAKQHEAWLLVLAGEYSSAEQSLQAAENLIHSSGKTMLDPYIHLTKTLLSQCQGKPLPFNSFQDSKTPNFLRYVAFVNNFDCVPERAVPNKPPPQVGNDDPPPTFEEPRGVANTPPPQESTSPPSRKRNNNQLDQIIALYRKGVFVIALANEKFAN